MALVSCNTIPALDKNVTSSTVPLTTFSSSELSSCESCDKTEDRQAWGSRLQFFLACIGYSVGLGNVWRFGYLCAKSGGGAFLIPYFINLIIVAIPLMYMEFSIGQFTQRGPIGAMAKICPLLKGVYLSPFSFNLNFALFYVILIGTGIATVVISFFLTTYYIVIITWAAYFFFSSFTSELPWSKCNNTWNSDDCWDGSLNISFKTSNDSKTPSEEFFRFLNFFQLFIFLRKQLKLLLFKKGKNF